MGTFSSNVSLRVSAAINVVGTPASIPGFVDLYTCPANAYADIQVLCTGAGHLTIGGNIIYAFNPTEGDSTGQPAGATFPFGSARTYTAKLKLGPNQTLRIVTFGSSATVTGVEFINSP